MAWTGVGEVNRDAAPVNYPMPMIFRHREALWFSIVKDLDTNASDPRSWDFLAQCAAMPHVHTIVEAGTYRGHGTFAMVESLYQHRKNDAHIFTADVEDYGVSEVLAATGTAPAVTFFHGRFEAMLDTIQAPIDLAFIDASEVERPLLRLEYVNLVLPRLSPHGLCIVDDCTDDAWAGAKMLRNAANIYFPVGHGFCLFQGKRE